MSSYWSIVKKNHPYIFGNIIEWYDFSLYGYFSLIITHQYFSFYPQDEALLATFLTFAVGLVARPAGAALFGWIGDRYSRDYSLRLSVRFIAWPTFLIGLLPSYSQWCMTASVALILLRLLQGLSAGGQYGGCIVLLMENNPQSRAQACSLAHIGSIIGYLLAITVSILAIQLIPEKWSETLAWRIPFLMSILLWWIQQITQKKPTSINKTRRKSMWKTLITQHKKPLAYATVLSAVGGLFYFSIFVYSISFLQQKAHDSLLESLLIGALAMILSCLALPGFAKLADRYGRKPILFISCLGLCLVAPLAIHWLQVSSGYLWSILGLLTLILLNTLFISAVTVVYSEIFEPAIRYSGCNIAFNVGLILLGAPSPVILSYLISHGSASLYGLYLSGGALLGLIVVSIMHETHPNKKTKIAHST